MFHQNSVKQVGTWATEKRQVFSTVEKQTSINIDQHQQGKLLLAGRVLQHQDEEGEMVAVVFATC